MKHVTPWGPLLLLGFSNIMKVLPALQVNQNSVCLSLMLVLGNQGCLLLPPSPSCWASTALTTCWTRRRTDLQL